jgi:hypothetical protein
MRYRVTFMWQRVFMTSGPRAVFTPRDGGALLVAAGLPQAVQQRVRERGVASVRARVLAAGDRGQGRR